ncbi:MAG: hypothetical protein D6707_11070 [Bacteroidetes bacterium]|nr:MAG: hypothetical protein D6707_11070 [Bacteroidota bacterium]
MLRLVLKKESFPIFNVLYALRKHKSNKFEKSIAMKSVNVVIYLSVLFVFTSCASSKSPDTEEQKQLQLKVVEITSSAAEKYKTSTPQSSSENDRTPEKSN